MVLPGRKAASIEERKARAASSNPVELKMAAKAVTGTNAESGVAEAIHTYALPRAPANAATGRKRSVIRRLLRLDRRG